MSSPLPHTDQLYINALISGDSMLLKEIYQRFAGAITNMVVNNSGTAADAADIMQEALLDIYKKAKDNSIILSCPFEAFLYAVCRNKWLMELRKRKNQPVTIIDERQYTLNDEGREAVEALVQYDQRKKLLLKKLEDLNEGCRKLLRLFWTGMALQDIAVQMDMSYGYARRKKGECLGRLIRLMKETVAFNKLKH
jgi:RNA polymerase sigma factor (sigma-70 family)